MGRNVYEVDDYDLVSSGNTKPAELDGRGPISIQPTVIGLVGNPTYTVEVSNDGTNWVEYHKSAKNRAIDDSIWIMYTSIPWMYIRFAITRTGSDAGILKFKLYLENG